MNNDKLKARWTGSLFLVSDVSSIVALILFQPLLKNKDYITAGDANVSLILLGAFFEILTALCVAGTAIALYPVLKRQNIGLALAYVIFRALEAVMILVGLLSVLAVLTLRTNFQKYGGEPEIYHIAGQALVAIKDWSFVFGPNILLGVNVTILGYLLLKSKAVPRSLGLLAFIDGPLIFISAILVLFGVYAQASPVQAIVALPMLIFEVWFSLRLILKGFDIIPQNETEIAK